MTMDTCKGCTMSMNCVIRNKAPIEIKRCPCRICLVKVMCTNDYDDTCDAYSNFIYFLKRSPLYANFFSGN